MESKEKLNSNGAEQMKKDALRELEDELWTSHCLSLFRRLSNAHSYKCEQEKNGNK